MITGHTGFKGSWLSIWLHHLGAKVSGVALPAKTEKDNYALSEIGEKINGNYFQDIRHLTGIKEIFDKEQPEVVFHLAAQPLVIESYKNPVETYETNVMGTVNLLEACRQTPSVHTIIVITTDKCYENKEWVWPYRENDPMGGYDPYSSSKGAAELICSAYRNSFFNPKKYQEHHKSLATMRAGNVIGGGDWSENRIIPDCVKALERHQILEIRNPNAVRPWQHVLEPLGAYLLLAEKMMNEPIAFAEAWNIGPETGKSVPVSKLIDEFIKHYGSGEWKDISDPGSFHEATMLGLDISKASCKLGWKPVLNFEDTIRLTAEWYLNYKSCASVMDLCMRQILYYENYAHSGK